MNHVTASAFAEVAIVTYRSMRANNPAAGQPAGSTLTVKGTHTASPYKAPLPSDFTAVVIVYGALHFLPDQLGGLIGWGLVAATFLNLWAPSSSSLTGLPAKSSPSSSPAK